MMDHAERSSITAIAKQDGMSGRSVGRILRLAFLAPEIVRSIVDGHQPAELELDRLLNGMPLSWDEQRRVLGFPDTTDLAGRADGTARESAPPNGP